MKIYIFADMEGGSGISGTEFVSATGKLYSLGRRYLTEDINACAEACFEAGATEVIVRDGHGAGNHVLWNELDPRVQLVQGPTPRIRFYGLDHSDAVILLGYHAMAGAVGAVLEHTYSSKSIQNMWLNGERVGEFAVDAAIAAEHGVPVILTSGDDKLCAEAKQWLPEVVCCQVKTGIGTQAALLLPRKQAHELIAEKTKEALSKIDSIPLKKLSPATLRKEMVERIEPALGAGYVPIDGRTSEITCDSVEQAFYGR